MDGNNNVINQDPVVVQPAAEPVPQPVVEPAPQPVPAYQEPVNPAPVYEQPVYNQGGFDQGYAQGGYQEPAPFAQAGPDLQGFNRVPKKCPGKEIVGFVFGINSIAWGALGLLFSWIPFYGMIFSFIWGGLFGVGCGIVALVMHKKVHEEAEEIGGKIETGKKLAIPGIIIGAVGCVVSVVVLIFVIAIVGIGAIGSISSMSNSYHP